MRKILAIAAMATLCFNQAQAKEHTGWIYNGLTGSASVNEDEFSDDSIGSNSSFGYRWGKVGIEIGSTYFGKFKDESIVGNTPVAVDSRLGGWTAGVNYSVDLNPKWSLLGRLGAFRWNTDSHVDAGAGRIAFDDSGTNLYAGASIDYNWRKRSSIGLGYTYFKANDADVHLWGIHSEFRF